MGTRDPPIGAYSEKAAPFAQPILECIRAVMHEACPSAEEMVKWSFLHFDYNGMMGSTASFKRTARSTFGSDVKYLATT